MPNLEDVFEQFQKDIRTAVFHAESQAKFRVQCSNREVNLNTFKSLFKRQLEIHLRNVQSKLEDFFNQQYKSPLSPDWIDNGDGTYTAQEGDSAWTLHEDTRISFEEAKQLLEEQGKKITINKEGTEISNIKVGDIIRVNDQKIIFINGKLGMGSPDGGEDYWVSDFVKAAKKYTGSNKVEFQNVDFNYLSSAERRYKRGYNNTMRYENSGPQKRGRNDLVVIVTHSMGGAYGEGVADALTKVGWEVKTVFHFNAFQAADIKAKTKRYTLDYQTTNDPVINNPIRSSPGEIGNSDLKIRIKSKSDYQFRHRSPIDNADTWEIIKQKIGK